MIQYFSPVMSGNVLPKKSDLLAFFLVQAAQWQSASTAAGRINH